MLLGTSPAWHLGGLTEVCCLFCVPEDSRCGSTSPAGTPGTPAVQGAANRRGWWQMARTMLIQSRRSPFLSQQWSQALKRDRKSSLRLHTCKVTDTNGTFRLVELLYWSTWPELALEMTWAEGDSICWRQWFIPRTCLLTAKAAQMTKMDHRALGATKGRWNGANSWCKKEIPDHVSMSYIKTSILWWGLKASGCLRICKCTVGEWARSGNT